MFDQFLVLWVKKKKFMMNMFDFCEQDLLKSWLYGDIINKRNHKYQQWYINGRIGSAKAGSAW